MSDTSIKKVLMCRDKMTAKEAYEDLQERLANGEYPFEICMEYFGLEPDYIIDLIY